MNRTGSAPLRVPGELERRKGSRWSLGRLAAFLHIPESEADIRPRCCGIARDVAAIVLLVRADGVDHNAVIEPPVAQRLAIMRIDRRLSQVLWDQSTERMRPALVLQTIAFDRQGRDRRTQHRLAALKRTREIVHGRT